MQELTKPCLGYNQILAFLRENRNIGLEHVYEKTNNFENNHTLQLPPSTNVIRPEKISVRISNRSFERISTSKPFNRLVGRFRSNLIRIKPCTGRSNNNVPNVMLSNTMSLAPKIDEIRNLALEFNLDLVCVAETWLRETISDNSIRISRWGTCAKASLGFQIPGYFQLRRNRVSDSHGGVCIYISEQI